MKKREITFREAISEAMSEEMRRDKSIYLMGEEVAQYNGAYKASKGMLKEFGSKRIIDTPISELGFSGIGIGSAMNGCRPIIEFMTFNFSLIAMDQIINNAAKIFYMSGGQWNIPIVFRGPTGSAGQLGATHSQSFESWFASCPGLKVVIPCNPYDAKGLLKSSIRDNNPVIFMESEQMYGDKMVLPEEEYLLPIGKASIKKKGNDVSLVSFGKMMKIAINAAKKLNEDNISVEVIDLQTIRPLDYNSIIISVKKTNRLVILEESWPFSSISSEISFFVQKNAFDYLDAPINRVTLLDTPAPYASNLMSEWFPDEKKVIKSIKETLYI
ncbi:pyruvate dehydrogenase complex E1 component subunit beta [Blattabacterium cuenoti]